MTPFSTPCLKETTLTLTTRPKPFAYLRLFVCVRDVKMPVKASTRQKVYRERTWKRSANGTGTGKKRHG